MKDHFVFTWIILVSLLVPAYLVYYRTMCVRPRVSYNQDKLLALRNDLPKDLRLPVELYKTLRDHGITKHKPTKRGCTAGVNHKQASVPASVDRSTPGGHELINCCLLNTRSVRNKALVVKDYVVEQDIDVLCLTETWLKPGTGDVPKIGDLKPEGYKLPHEPRIKGRGGGVGVLHRSNVNILPQTSVEFKSFEYMETILKTSTKCVRVIVIYRPPPSQENGLTCRMFLEEFSTFLEQQTISA